MSQPPPATLEGTASVFGRLIHLASLPHRPADDPSFDPALERAHAAAFRAWLLLPLHKKHDDLEIYRAEAQSDTTLVRPFSPQPYLPVTATEAEAALFASEMEILIDVISSNEE